MGQVQGVGHRTQRLKEGEGLAADQRRAVVGVRIAPRPQAD